MIGLPNLMRFNFFSLRHPLICFSRFNASILVLYFSVYKIFIALCNLVCQPPLLVLCSLNLLLNC